MGLPAILGQVALQIGLPAARDFFAGRDEEEALRKAQRTNRSRTAESNLINAFLRNPSNRPSLVQPEVKRSGLTRALGAANTGLQAFNTFNQIRDADTFRDLRNRSLEQGLEEGERKLQREAGAAAASAFDTPSEAALRPDLQSEIGQQIAKESRPVAPPSLTSKIGQGAFRDQARGLRQADEATALNTKNVLSQIRARETTAGAALQRAINAGTTTPTDSGAAPSKVAIAAGSSAGRNNPFMRAEDYRRSIITPNSDPGLIELQFDAFTAAQRETQETVSEFITGSIDRGLKTNAGLAFNEFEAQMSNLGLPITPTTAEQFGKSVVSAGPIELVKTLADGTEEVVKLSGENATRLPRVLFLERETDALVKSMRSVDGEALLADFGALSGRVEEVDKFFRKGGALSPETNELLLRLGLTSDMLARLRSGGAINETEMNLYFNEFMGGLSENPQALLGRMETLNRSFAMERQTFFDAARIERGIQVPERAHQPIVGPQGTADALRETALRKRREELNFAPDFTQSPIPFR